MAGPGEGSPCKSPAADLPSSCSSDPVLACSAASPMPATDQQLSETSRTGDVQDVLIPGTTHVLAAGQSHANAGDDGAGTTL